MTLFLVLQMTSWCQGRSQPHFDVESPPQSKHGIYATYMFALCTRSHLFSWIVISCSTFFFNMCLMPPLWSYKLVHSFGWGIFEVCPPRSSFGCLLNTSFSCCILLVSVVGFAPHWAYKLGLSYNYMNALLFIWSPLHSYLACFQYVGYFLWVYIHGKFQKVDMLSQKSLCKWSIVRFWSNSTQVYCIGHQQCRRVFLHGFAKRMCGQRFDWWERVSNYSFSL